MAGFHFQASRPRCSAGARPLLVLAVLGASLFSAGSALGAMGTGIPQTSTGPDLRSISLTGASSAQFCFDKPIATVALQNGFYLGGYRADNFITSTTASASGSCVNATFNGSDLVSHSFGQVAGDAVRITGGSGNDADSSALIGSTSHNGTRGLTTAPDLATVAVASGPGVLPNSLAFKFDQAVGPTVVGSGGFGFYTADGTLAKSNSAAVSTTDPTTVIVSFPVGAGPLFPTVANATRGVVTPGAVKSATGEATPSTWDTAAISGVGATVPPYLIGAQYVVPAPGTQITAGGGCAGNTRCVEIDYSFSTGVTVGGVDAYLNNYWAYLSDGTAINPEELQQDVPGSSVVRALYDPASDLADNHVNASNFDEYLVKAAVTVGANTGDVPLGGVAAYAAGTPTPSTVANTIGSAPIGGNANAFASGYSTGPDAINLSFDTTHNTATVLFDQRVFSVDPTHFFLLGPDGNPIAAATSASGGSPTCQPPGIGLATGTTSPGPFLVCLTFPSPTALVAAGDSLEIATNSSGYAVGTNSAPAPLVPIGPFDITNVQQIIAPNNTAVHLRASKNVSHRRMTRALLRRIEAQQLGAFVKNLKHGKYKHSRHR